MKNYILIIALSLASFASYSQNEMRPTDKIAETTYIEFHSSYLVNLHHFIFNKAMRFSFYKNDNQKQYDTLFAELKTPVDDKTKSNVMNAVNFYVDSLSKKNMLFDKELTSFKYALQGSADFNELRKNSNSTLIIEAMQKADAFYKKYYWTEQNKRNNEFIQTKITTITGIEEDVMANCSKYYQYTFSGKKFRVDLTDYATFFAAYTTTEPYVSAIISSTNKKHDGTQGIEVIFHEISHAMIDSVFVIQQNICTSKNLPFDHNVWHSILFYSTGTFVKNALSKVGQEHELYMYKNKLADFNPDIKKTMIAINNYWQQYLDNKISMQNAIEYILIQNN